jgi:hypothetical protein
MRPKESDFLSDFTTKPTEGALDPKWSEALEYVLQRIENHRGNLVRLTKVLFVFLKKIQMEASFIESKLHFIFLTRQGVPVYWLLKGIYDSKFLPMPEYDVLGVKSPFTVETTPLHIHDKQDLCELLRINDKDSLNIFIDETLSRGRAINTCYKLVELLNGDKSRYLDAIFSPDINAPWDIKIFDSLNEYPQDSNKFLSIHPYLAPNLSLTHNQVSPPTPNQNYNSHILISQVATKLYEIGLEAGSTY